MSIAGIHDQLLEITVLGCTKLKDTEWFSRQDPYVCIDYASSKFRTRTCTDGGRNPTFHEKFTLRLVEGLTEIDVSVWNSNTISQDYFIGNGKIQLLKVLSDGYDDSNWLLQTKSGKSAGVVRVIMHYPNSKMTSEWSPYGHLHSKPSMAPPEPYVAGYHPYGAHPPSTYSSHTHAGHVANALYPPQAYSYQPAMHQPTHSAYPPPSAPYYANYFTTS